MKPGTIFEKQYFRRSIEGYRSPYDDPFEYKTVPEVGEEYAQRLLIPFLDDKSNPDRLAQAKIEWSYWTWSEGPRYRPEFWLVAFKDGEAIGVVFPTKYDDMPSEGSISFIAVVPEHQGKGYSKILHAKGLESLANLGVTKYVGSTEVTNVAMLSVARANGCAMTKIYKIQVDELGRHIPVKDSGKP